jgi:hypothetical protein
MKSILFKIHLKINTYLTIMLRILKTKQRGLVNLVKLTKVKENTNKNGLLINKKADTVYISPTHVIPTPCKKNKLL